MNDNEEEDAHNSLTLKSTEAQSAARKRRELPDTVTGTSNGKAPTVSSHSKKKTKRAADGSTINLSQSQIRVINAILMRKSVFFTGAAGTGKSFILRVLQDISGVLKITDKVAFTASTGVAACNVRGVTVHSWTGVGRGTDPLEKIVAMASGRRDVKNRWMNTEILVIDEISMLSAELFDIISFLGIRLRNDPRPFGGIQLILCGDFFQLPPIGVDKSCHFCFESAIWKEMLAGEDGMIVLDRVFRQKDTTFLRMLNELRLGYVSKQTNAILTEKVRESAVAGAMNGNGNSNSSGYGSSSGSHHTRTAVAGGAGAGEGKDTAGTKTKKNIVATKLFPTNNNVDSYNSAELRKLPDEEKYDFNAVPGQGSKEPYLSQLMQGIKAPQQLELRVGAQVMLLKNVSTARGLVNGARGVVVSFEKSQDRSSLYPVIPLVKFSVRLGEEVEEVEYAVVEDTWDIQVGGREAASVQQLPLMLAWAISVHKSQGMTIPFLEVSFQGMFEYGQGYVALSRATDLEGLILHSFEPRAIKAHQKVRDFYSSMGYDVNRGEDIEDNLVETSLQELASRFVVTSEGHEKYDDDEWISSKNTTIHSSLLNTGKIPSFPSSSSSSSAAAGGSSYSSSSSSAQRASAGAGAGTARAVSQILDVTGSGGGGGRGGGGGEIEDTWMERGNRHRAHTHYPPPLPQQNQQQAQPYLSQTPSSSTSSSSFAKASSYMPTKASSYMPTTTSSSSSSSSGGSGGANAPGGKLTLSDFFGKSRDQRAPAQKYTESFENENKNKRNSFEEFAYSSNGTSNSTSTRYSNGGSNNGTATASASGASPASTGGASRGLVITPRSTTTTMPSPGATSGGLKPSAYPSNQSSYSNNNHNNSSYAGGSVGSMGSAAVGGAGTKTAAAPAAAEITITEEMRRRIEANRQEALRRKEEKRKRDEAALMSNLNQLEQYGAPSKF